MSEIDDEDVSEFISLVKKSAYTGALTGAGVSTDSGIPDFRSPNGLYSKVPGDIFDLTAFYRNPTRYYSIAMKYVHNMGENNPNDTHIMLFLLEKMGYLKGISTQNIDGLHKKAGSKNVFEIHGNANIFSCVDCGKKYTKRELLSILYDSKKPLCDCGGIIKPEVVFFGEQLPYEQLKKSEELALNSELFVVIGTSLSVYPAAQLPIIAKNNGAKIIIINRTPTELDFIADYSYRVNLAEFSKKVIEAIH